jgi:uncharacterized membrane protein YbhN (UPF0104 family)
LGAAPFLAGLRSTDAVALALAVVATGVTTVCAARRWSAIADGLGVPVRMGRAVAAYYRSQFLNVTLPGGVLGDVHRAVDHGRQAGQLGKSARAVAWERTAGQVVQIALSVVVLLVVASPVHDRLPRMLGVAALVLGSAAVVAAVLARRGRGRVRLAIRTAASDVRSTMLVPTIWPWVLGASAVAAAGHVALFVVAARAVDSTVSVGRIVPIAIVVVLASALPLNIAGWGPREGVAAWAFGAAGLGAAEGVTVSVVYGVMVLVATLPGAVVLFGGLLTHGRRTSGEQDEASAPREVARV